MPHINLLPWREEARELKQKQFVAVLAVTAVIVIVIGMLISSFYSGQIEQQNKRNQYIRNEIAVLNTKIEEIKELKAKRADLEKRMGLIADLQRNRNLGAQILDELVKVVPPGIYLTELEKRDASVTVKGKSESNNRLSNMLRKIESSWLLGDPILNSIVAAQVEPRILSDFQMSMKVKPVNQTAGAQATDKKGGS
ncbi:pilus assembly protein PilN [Saccharobesus litoralis]|uniref:Pilus assembly protein PilN n=1 Tax=Saccharobesus litoralis TaxID=2172099 RepID=A0A2S0VQL7_9ALTE|nr:PilN domain-containing protein [Saccharobesus litoralis]AWB66489.1 pilus assembly protein PilN [Saccharobesus litoralis]